MLAGNRPLDTSRINIKVPTKYLDNNSVPSLFVIEKDLYRKNIKASTLNNPTILNYYLNGWRYWN